MRKQYKVLKEYITKDRRHFKVGEVFEAEDTYYNGNDDLTFLGALRFYDFIKEIL